MKKLAALLLSLCILASILTAPAAAAKEESPFKDLSLEDLFMFQEFIDAEITLRLSHGEKSSWYNTGLGAELPTPMNEHWKKLKVLGTPINTSSQFYAVVQMDEDYDDDIYIWKLENFFDFAIAINNSALATNSATKDDITVTITKEKETMTMTIQATKE